MALGVFIVGALGEVSSTLIAGHEALKRKLVNSVGLVSYLDDFNSLNFIDEQEIVFSGVDVRQGDLESSMRQIVEQGGAIPWGVYQNLLEHHFEKTLPSITHIDQRFSGEEKLEFFSKQLDDFVQQVNGRCLILYLASTEDLPQDKLIFCASLSELDKQIKENSVPDSVLWAHAAIKQNMSFINFTPSLGINVPVLMEEANRSIVFAGNDGKTGETLLKSVLAPMFQSRHLDVMSWESLNLLGNNDGRNLKDPQIAQAKIENKNSIVPELLKKETHTKTRIDYTPSLGDWKTAWDFIHFKGFLGTPMSLQFTWQGCDSALAAPLCLDLVRFADCAYQMGQRGNLDQLACFFKNPINARSHHYFEQFGDLISWARQCHASE